MAVARTPPPRPPSSPIKPDLNRVISNNDHHRDPPSHLSHPHQLELEPDLDLVPQPDKSHHPFISTPSQPQPIDRALFNSIASSPSPSPVLSPRKQTVHSARHVPASLIPIPTTSIDFKVDDPFTKKPKIVRSPPSNPNANYDPNANVNPNPEPIQPIQSPSHDQSLLTQTRRAPSQETNAVENPMDHTASMQPLGDVSECLRQEIATLQAESMSQNKMLLDTRRELAAQAHRLQFETGRRTIAEEQVSSLKAELQAVTRLKVEEETLTTSKQLQNEIEMRTLAEARLVETTAFLQTALKAKIELEDRLLAEMAVQKPREPMDAADTTTQTEPNSGLTEQQLAIYDNQIARLMEENRQLKWINNRAELMKEIATRETKLQHISGYVGADAQSCQLAPGSESARLVQLKEVEHHYDLLRANTTIADLHCQLDVAKIDQGLLELRLEEQVREHSCVLRNVEQFQSEVKTQHQRLITQLKELHIKDHEWTRIGANFEGLLEIERREKEEILKSMESAVIEPKIEINSMKYRLVKVEQNLLASETKVTRLLACLAEKDAQIHVLIEESAQSRAQVEELQDKKNRLRSEHTATTKSLERARVDLQDFQATVSEMEEQIATLTRKVRVSERDAREKSSSVILQKQKLTAGTEPTQLDNPDDNKEDEYEDVPLNSSRMITGDTWVSIGGCIEKSSKPARRKPPQTYVDQDATTLPCAKRPNKSVRTGKQKTVQISKGAGRRGRPPRVSTQGEVEEEGGQEAEEEEREDERPALGSENSDHVLTPQIEVEEPVPEAASPPALVQKSRHRKLGAVTNKSVTNHIGEAGRAGGAVKSKNKSGAQKGRKANDVVNPNYSEAEDSDVAVKTRHREEATMQSTGAKRKVGQTKRGWKNDVTAVVNHDNDTSGKSDNEALVDSADKRAKAAPKRRAPKKKGVVPVEDLEDELDAENDHIVLEVQDQGKLPVKSMKEKVKAASKPRGRKKKVMVDENLEDEEDVENINHAKRDQGEDEVPLRSAKKAKVVSKASARKKKDGSDENDDNDNDNDDDDDEQQREEPTVARATVAKHIGKVAFASEKPKAKGKAKRNNDDGIEVAEGAGRENPGAKRRKIFNMKNMSRGSLALNWNEGSQEVDSDQNGLGLPPELSPVKPTRPLSGTSKLGDGGILPLTLLGLANGKRT